MKRLNLVISKVLCIDEHTITDETSPENVETWDSFNGLMMVSELERIFNVHFSLTEITSVKSVKDIRLCLERHGVILKND